MHANPASNDAILASITGEADALRDTLLRLSNQNSGSFNVDGVDAVGASLLTLFAPLGASAETIALPQYIATGDRGERSSRPIGHARRLRLRPEAPLQVFLCGHLDTVFGAAHPFQQARWLDADTLNGPGVADLKGGLLTMLLALTALERSSQRERIGWEVLLNPDEEIGSQGSAPLLLEAASHHHFGLIYEPAYADGGLASERKGSGNFDLVIEGRAAHAGRNPEDGRNAIALAAELALQLHRLNGQRDGLTLNLGYTHGGGALNIVPDRAVLKFNVRTSQPSDECWLDDQLDLLLTRANDRNGFKVERHGGFTRPPKVISAGTAQLQALLGDCGRDLGLELQFRPTGGCCDGNNLAAAGLANVDNLGVVGGDIHSDREWMRWSSLAERARLSASLLLKLASGALHWPLSTPRP
ncbi:hydrolase [Nevskia ramosa]|uniref:hydrolase n=1 Tax=Nevskia ramosa TaxID=64002 RepID=UPI00235483C2|nr:hydrolase [Nevskia ramosa]